VVIDPRVERSARKMLGHAIRHELEDLASLVRSVGDETFVAVVDLCVLASGYMAIDICARWPTDADLRDLARRAEQSVTRLDVSKEQIYEFLSRVALGNEMLDDVFDLPATGLVPLYTTANLLSKFRPREKDWWEYLDQVWNAVEATARLGPEELPALMLSVRKDALRSGREPGPLADGAGFREWFSGLRGVEDRGAAAGAALAGG
jgi:hypothetical protein